jgi:hypothetical protein
MTAPSAVWESKGFTSTDPRSSRCVWGCVQHQKHGAGFIPAFGIGFASWWKHGVKQMAAWYVARCPMASYSMPWRTMGRTWAWVVFHILWIHEEVNRCKDNCFLFSKLTWSIPWAKGACKTEHRHCPTAYIVVELYMWVSVTKLFEAHTCDLLRGHMICGTSCCWYSLYFNITT